MITTSFYIPHTINQVETYNTVTNEPSIGWTVDSLIAPSTPAITTKRLYTISGLWMEQFRSVTSQLWCTHLNIPNFDGTLAGIEFLFNCSRQARIQDNTIQLTLNGELIGNNYASLDNPVQSSMYTGESTPIIAVGDIHTYGNPSDLWGTTLTSADIADPTFGIVISLSSNHIYPHNDLAYVNEIGIRVTYA